MANIAVAPIASTSQQVLRPKKAKTSRTAAPNAAASRGSTVSKKARKPPLGKLLASSGKCRKIHNNDGELAVYTILRSTNTFLHGTLCDQQTSKFARTQSTICSFSWVVKAIWKMAKSKTLIRTQRARPWKRQMVMMTRMQKTNGMQSNYLKLFKTNLWVSYGRAAFTVRLAGKRLLTSSMKRSRFSFSLSLILNANDLFISSWRHVHVR